MTNSNKYFNLIQEFQTKRQNISDTYNRELAELKRYEGSEYFETESKSAADRRDRTLKELQIVYRGKLDEVLKAMSEANANREMQPPTDSELRLLEMLRMKDSVSEEELRAAANTLRKNPTCLEILTEIGRKHGFARGYEHFAESNTLGTKSTRDAIAALANGADDFLRFDTRRAARIARRYQENNFGVSENAPALPKRRPIQSKEQCFMELGTLSADALEPFFNAVDREGE